MRQLKALAKRVGWWTPSYLRARIAAGLHEWSNPGDPWWNQEAIGLIDRLVQPTDIGLEFGAGRSTSWLARRIKHVTSVESDRQWIDRVQSDLKRNGLTNVDLRLRETKESYLNVCNEFPDESLDFVLVDGAFDRGWCALQSVAKVRPGGLLVIDNVSWFLPSNSPSPLARTPADGPSSPEWARFLSLTADWRRIWTHNGLPHKDLVIYVKTPVRALLLRPTTFHSGSEVAANVQSSL